MKPLETKHKIMIAVILIVCFCISLYGRLQDVKRELRVKEQQREWESTLNEMAMERQIAASTPKTETIVMENGVVSAEDVKVKIPSEFDEVQEASDMVQFLAPDYANIVVMSETFTSRPVVFPSEKELQESMQNTFQQTLDEGSEIAVTEYETYQIETYDALRVTARFTNQGVDMVQTQCMIATDSAIVLIVYTQNADGAWDTEFEKSIASITVK